MIVVKLITFMLLFTAHHCRLPDKVYCVNEQCNEPISKARTVLKYTSGDVDLMSFRGNAEATIFMKSAGANPDLWYATIDGKSGFVSSRFLKENKIYVKEPAHILPVQVKKKAEVLPDKVQQAHEVVEGTTLYSAEPEATTSPPIAHTNDGSTLDTSQNPDLALNNINMWNNNKPDLKIADPTNTGELGITTPLPPGEPESIQGTPSPSEASQLPQEATVTVASAEVKDEEFNIKQDILTPTKTDEPKTTEAITESNNISTETIKQNLPPAHDSLPLQEPPKSGESMSAEVYDVPKQLDLIKQALKQPEMINNLESIISNPRDSIETQLHPETQSNVPNNDPNQPDQVPQLDKTLFGNVKQDGVLNVNGEVSNFASQDSIPSPSDATLISQQINSGSAPTSAESVATSTETAQTLTENVPVSTVSPPMYTESIPISTESVSMSTEKNQISTETNAMPNESVPSSTESVPITMEGIPTSTETSPLLPENTYQSTSNTESLLSQEPSSLPVESAPNQQSQETSDYYSYSTEPTPSNDIYNTPSSLDNTQDTFDNENVNTTPEPDTSVSEEDGGGFISSMLSTVSNMWESTTPEPASESVKDSTEWEANIAPPPVADEKDDSFSFVSYLFSTYNAIMGTQEQSRALFASTGETCSTDEFCDGSGSSHQNSRLLTFLLTSASTVLLFSLGYYYLDNRRQDGKLIGNINALQRDLLFTTKECEILKEELTTTKNKLAGIEDSSFGMDDMVLSLKEEINELKAQNERLRHSLDDNEKLLRVSENTAGELQNTLSEVENTLGDLLGERANLEEQIAELNGKVQAFEEELISVSRDRDNYQLKYVSAETALEESKKQKKLLEELNAKLQEANNTINLQKHEISALKDALREMKNGLSPNVDVGALIDHTEIKAKLAKAWKRRRL